MCKFASGIMKYKMSGIWWDMDLDSHSDLMEKFGIKDEKTPAAFVKFEMTPKDHNPFNHSRENWRLEADQDQIPEWWDRKRAEEMFWPILQSIFAERFLVDVLDVRKIEIGRWYTKDSKINMWGGSIANMRGGSIANMWSGSIADMWGGSIANMRGGSIADMWGGSIADMRGGSIADMWGGSIADMRGGSIADMRGGSIANMRGGEVKNQSGKATIFDGYKILVADKAFTLEFVGSNNAH
jgi:hypothetical protein